MRALKNLFLLVVVVMMIVDGNRHAAASIWVTGL